jgi:hypothetical protein
MTQEVGTARSVTTLERPQIGRVPGRSPCLFKVASELAVRPTIRSLIANKEALLRSRKINDDRHVIGANRSRRAAARGY